MIDQEKFFSLQDNVIAQGIIGMFWLKQCYLYLLKMSLKRGKRDEITR